MRLHQNIPTGGSKMAIDRFTKAEFEAVLPVSRVSGDVMWACLGVIDGEYVYIVPVKKGVLIRIRSSVSENGLARASSEDSIRIWITDVAGHPVGSKVISYTTRVTGWEGRLTAVLRTLWKRANSLTTCPDCGKYRGIYKVKKEGRNKGRLFTKCWDHGHFQWVDEDNVPVPKQKKSLLFFDEKKLPHDKEVWGFISELSSIRKRAERVRNLIEEDDSILFYALKRIYSFQTAGEQASRQTVVDNGVGFSGLDANFLSSLAEQSVARGLSHKQVTFARKKMVRYSGQVERTLREDFA
jgi:hypothetical protein